MIALSHIDINFFFVESTCFSCEEKLLHIITSHIARKYGNQKISFIKENIIMYKYTLRN